MSLLRRFLIHEMFDFGHHLKYIIYQDSDKWKHARVLIIISKCKYENEA